MSSCHLWLFCSQNIVNPFGIVMLIILITGILVIAFQDLEETCIVGESKLHDIEETLRQSRDHILEMKM